jgi:hypothetical protein
MIKDVIIGEIRPRDGAIDRCCPTHLPFAIPVGIGPVGGLPTFANLYANATVRLGR